MLSHFSVVSVYPPISRQICYLDKNLSSSQSGLLRHCGRRRSAIDKKQKVFWAPADNQTVALWQSFNSAVSRMMKVGIHGLCINPTIQPKFSRWHYSFNNDIPSYRKDDVFEDDYCGEQKCYVEDFSFRSMV
ncbi:hypothetical protein CEXT_161291 [Caerostris extrusa]|uniref:Uncharacterized protein n=1 Tax=Caerostris extrusa TaxID=172846 RepID=A0AAV4V7L0_CAEEX|nr:hypothetical protein CEXT_161291 [Caerostris extrusa]